VATRWLILFPVRRSKDGTQASPADQDIWALTQCPERIALLRKRLCSLSWFMGRLNEFIARAANKEDQVKGRFWESRFKCQELLDGAAITSCMVYADLNLIRAGLAETPEDSDFTSIQERIRSWQRAARAEASAFAQVQNRQSENPGGSTKRTAEFGPSEVPSPDGDAFSSDWLCPIASDSKRRGILQMTATEYFELVDRSGRLVRSGKSGAMDPDLLPILLRIGAKPDAWIDTVSHFGSRFRLAAGMISNLRNWANKLGNRWTTGVTSARTAFA